MRLILYLEIRARVRVMLRQEVVMVGVRLLSQEMNASLCNIPKSDQGQHVRVCVCERERDKENERETAPHTTL